MLNSNNIEISPSYKINKSNGPTNKSVIYKMEKIVIIKYKKNRFQYRL